MPLLESIMIPLGTQMPSWSLKDPTGRVINSSQVVGENGLLVAFTCNHCPYAIAIWPRLIQMAAYAKALSINTVAINPNINPAYPEDAPEMMLEKIQDWNIDFPYLIDESQTVARDFQAQCTPDLYLFDADQKLVYHGRMDDNWQDEQKVTQYELKEAVDQLAANQKVSTDQRPSMGCSIKWVDPS